VIVLLTMQTARRDLEFQRMIVVSPKAGEAAVPLERINHPLRAFARYALLSPPFFVRSTPYRLAPRSASGDKIWRPMDGMIAPPTARAVKRACRKTKYVL
jgi:hypothetical protein